MCTDAGPNSLNGPVFYWMSRCSERKVYSSRAFVPSTKFLQTAVPPLQEGGGRGGQAGVLPGKAGQGGTAALTRGARVARWRRAPSANARAAASHGTKMCEGPHRLMTAILLRRRRLC